MHRNAQASQGKTWNQRSRDCKPVECNGRDLFQHQKCRAQEFVAAAWGSDGNEYRTMGPKARTTQGNLVVLHRASTARGDGCSSRRILQVLSFLICPMLAVPGPLIPRTHLSCPEMPVRSSACATTEAESSDPSGIWFAQRRVFMGGG